MLSIIIITKNEQDYLPKLLQSIQNQSLNDYEVIVSDGNSTDATRDIAKTFGCRVIDGGLNHVTGRNIGASQAQGDLLLFLDADVIMPKNIINKLLIIFNSRKLDCCTVFYKPISDKKIDMLLYNIYNYYSFLTQYFYAHSSGFFILCKAELFKKVGGFDERLLAAEDFDFVKRLSKYGKFRIVRELYILNSIRRIEDWGRKKILVNYLRAEISRIFKGEMYQGTPFQYTLHGGTEIGKKNAKQ